MKLGSRAALIVGLGTALAIAPAGAALAADHEATVNDGMTNITLDLGAEAANARTGVVIVGIDANAAAPSDSDVFYTNEVSLNDLGVAEMSISLPSADLESYRILANYADGTLYSAPLVGEEPGGGAEGGASTGADGGADGGTGSADGGSGSAGGAADGGAGGGNAGGGAASGADGGAGTSAGTGSGAGVGNGAGNGTDQLELTGASGAWIAAAAAGGVAVAAGVTLLVVKRKRSAV